MELKPGYKQTEVGVIPEDWSVRSSSELCIKIQDGTHFSPTLGGNDYLYITSKNIGAGTLDVSDAETISAAQHKAIYARCDVKKGDLLLTKDGANTGNAALNHLNEQFSLLSSVAFLRFDLEKNDPGYFLQHILSPQGQVRIKQLVSGNAITRLTLAKIRSFRFPVPPLLEQRAIAAALSDVDALLASLDALIAKKRDVKLAAMQQLLSGKQRLPEFGKDEVGYRQTEVGVIPEDWSVAQIQDVASVKTGPFGSSLHERDYVQDGTPIITVEHLDEFGIVHSNLPMVSDADRQRLKAYSLKENDIVFSRVGSIDRNALVRPKEAGWLFSGRLLRLRPSDEKVSSQYLSYHFHSEPFKLRVRSIAVGQTMPSLNTKILSGIKIVLPPFPEQVAIAAVLSDMDAEIAALEARRDKTRLLKQGMMQELLTGRIRLV